MPKPDKYDEALPEWEICEERVNAACATPLEIFLYNNEPAGKDSRSFRRQLADALRSALERKETK